MRIAAATIVKNEANLLPLWFQHYAPMVDALTVLDHGTDDGSIEALKDKFTFNWVKLDGNELFNYQYTNSVTKWYAREVLKDVDWLLFADADEYVFPDPNKYKDLRQFIEDGVLSYYYTTGYDVVMDVDNDAPLDVTAPILGHQRKRCVAAPLYSKPILTSIPLDWTVGNHILETGSPQPHPDLAMFHLKLADFEIYKPRAKLRFPGMVDAKIKQVIEGAFAKSALVPERFIGVL